MRCKINIREISGNQCGERAGGGETHPGKRGGLNVGVGQGAGIGRDSVDKGKKNPL